MLPRPRPGIFFDREFFSTPGSPSASRDARTLAATSDLEDAATNRVREVRRLYSTGAAAGAVELAVEFGPLDLGESARNGPYDI
jgi:hypothetical protein